MQIVIGTVDGKTHESVEFTWEEIADEIKGDGFAVGTNQKGQTIYCRNADQFVEFLEDMLKYDTKNDTQTFAMNTDEGRKVNFNVAHVAWWEIIRP